MTSAANARESICGKFGLKPITTQNVLYHYAPLQGVLSYTVLSVNVMNPSLMLRLFPKRDITNILLLHTFVGTGLYIYSRSHLKALPQKERLLYSSFGAVMFTFGSVLTWAILRSVVPQNVALCTTCGIGTSLAFISIARNYGAHVDSLVKP